MYGKLAIALLGVAALGPLSQAQQIRGSLITGPGRSRLSSSSAMGHLHRPPLVFSPYLYSDYPASEYPAERLAGEAPQPEVVVVQMPLAAAAVPKEPRPEPLLIEWQGDRYVRISGKDGATERVTPAPLDYVGSSASKPSTKRSEVSPPVTTLPPVVLVYRDGKQEELRDYTIADGIIYARGDYWTDGYWNKKIQLVALNLPATMKASQDRGAKFVLPASANEVITRP